MRAASADPLNALIRIACGGGSAPSFRDDAPLLMSDGETYAHPVAIDRTAANAAPEAVYQHERFAPEIVYAIPAPTSPAGKSYLVRLHFAELYDEGVGKRRQDVVINGETKHTLYVANDNDYSAVVPNSHHAGGTAENPNKLFVFAFDEVTERRARTAHPTPPWRARARRATRSS